MVSHPAGPGAAIMSLSPNDAIQFILADIPIFSVGILALGTFTFFFLMKRVDRWVFFLHLSVFLSFLAAVFDLSQLLIQGRSSSSADTSNDTIPAGVSGLITAREVFYGFANGFRFLFYWGFVAMIPVGETIPEGNKMHSGSWRRWGPIGLVLKWSTLLLVLLITIFQLLYRDIPALEQVGPVYEAAAALEVILSAIFVLKLLLNTWVGFSVGTITPSKGKMLVQYAPMIVALMFSMWIGVGNVILFEFTETVLGRFVRAIELYVAVVYMLTISFHHLRHLSFFPVYRPSNRSDIFTRGSIDKSGDIFSTKNAAPGRQKIDLVEGRYRVALEVPQTVERNSQRSGRVESVKSFVSRLSSWMLVRRSQQGPGQVWRVDRERGLLPVVDAVITPWHPPEQAGGRSTSPVRTPPPVRTSPPVLDDDERRGVVARLSSWMLVGRRSQQGPAQVWDVDMERGPSPVVDAVVTQPGQEGDRSTSPDLTPPPVLDDDERRGASPLPEYPVTEAKPPEPTPSSTTPLTAQPANDQPIDDQLNDTPEGTPVPSRDWQDIEYSNAVRHSGVSEGVLANALSQEYYKTEDGSPIASNIQIVSPSDDEASMVRNSIDAYSQDITLPDPTSPLASAAVTPVPRSRPLPPMPAPYRRTSLLASPMTPMPPDSARSSNISLLLRRQNELDQSIAALRLFSPSKQQFDVNQAPVNSSMSDYEYSPNASDRASNNDSLQGVGIAYTSLPSPELPLTTPGGPPQPSAKTQTEFYIDQRPPLNRSSMDSAVIPAQVKSQNQLAPPSMPNSRFSDSSSVGDRDRRIDSMGTQYDITSFVGNLTVPVNQKDSITSWTSVAYSEEGLINVATIANPPTFARPTLITRQPSLTKPQQQPGLPTASAPAARRVLPQVPQRAPQPQATQLQARQPVAASNSPAPSGLRRLVGLPANPRLRLNLASVEEKASSPSSDTVPSPQSRSGTPMTGRAL